MIIFIWWWCESESRSVLSDSLGPHGLYNPRNTPGQNAGAGSHSLLQGIFPTQGSNPGLPLCRQILYHLNHQGSPESGRRSVVPNFLPPHGLCRPRNSPGQNTGVGSLSLLQGIFPTQESNLCLPHCRRIPYQLSYQGSPDGAVWFNWDNTYKHLE